MHSGIFISTYFRKRYRLSGILHSLSVREATNPRDFVYGALGLLDDDMRADIMVDYGQPTARIYTETVRLLCQTNPNQLPDLWSFHPQTRKAIGSLPSWCPDFSQRSAEMQFNFLTTPLLGEDVVKMFSSYASVTFNKQCDVITCTVLQLDQVRSMVGGGREFSENLIQPYVLLLDFEQIFPLLFYLGRRRWVMQTLGALSDDEIEKLLLLDCSDVSPKDVSQLSSFLVDMDSHQINSLSEARERLDLDQTFEEHILLSMYTLVSRFQLYYVFKTTSGR